MESSHYQDESLNNAEIASSASEHLSELLPLELVLLIVKLCIPRKTIVIRKPYYGVGRLAKLIYFQKDLAEISEHLNLRLVSRLFYHTVWKDILTRFDGKLRVLHNMYALYTELDFQPLGKYCWLWPRVTEISLALLGDVFNISRLNLSRLPCLTKVTLEHMRELPKTVARFSDIADIQIISSIEPDELLMDIFRASDDMRKTGLTLALKIRYCVHDEPTEFMQDHKSSPGIELDITNKDNVFVIARYTNIDFTNQLMDIPA